jgi:hypothetical protein
MAGKTHVLVTEMLEQLQLSVGSLRQDRRAEWLHDLLDRHGLAGQLVARRATGEVFRLAGVSLQRDIQNQNIPDEPEGSHAHRLEVRIPKKQISAKESMAGQRARANRLVISKVVPKIWDRTNSAILKDRKRRAGKERKGLLVKRRE